MIHSPEYRRVLNSVQWSDLRRKAIADCGGRCRKCGDRAAFLQLHHANGYRMLGREELP